jgi:hypothetical protein
VLWNQRVVRGRLAQLLVLLVASVLTSASAGFAQPQYFCRMMERVAETCCCAASRELESPAHEVRASARDCCERIAPVATSLGNGSLRSDKLVAPALLSLLLDEPTYVFERSFVETVMLRGGRDPPARPGSPLFITNCALLI